MLLAEWAFIYMGIAGIFTFLSIMRKNVDDMAAIMWFAISIIYLPQYGNIFVVFGIVMGLLHLNIAITDDYAIYKKWKEKRVKN